MASLICWASGLLEVTPDKDVQPDGGPVVLMTGIASRLRTVMTAHAEFREKPLGWYVPGTRPVPQGTQEKQEAAAVQHANMTLVIAFNKKLQQAHAKKKGRLVEPDGGGE